MQSVGGGASVGLDTVGEAGLNLPPPRHQARRLAEGPPSHARTHPEVPSEVDVRADHGEQPGAGLAGRVHPADREAEDGLVDPDVDGALLDAHVAARVAPPVQLHQRRPLDEGPVHGQDVHCPDLCVPTQHGGKGAAQRSGEVGSVEAYVCFQRHLPGARAGEGVHMRACNPQDARMHSP